MSFKRAAKGTIVTVLIRIVSFVCTQLTMRKLDPSALGQTNIQLELLLTTILFWRTGARYALTNQSGGSANMNVGYLTIPLSILASMIAGVWHWRTSADESDDYRAAGFLYCAAACLEGCAEPIILFSLRNLNVSLKASAEGLASVCKAVGTTFALRIWSPVTAVGVGQLLYATMYCLFLCTSSFGKIVPPTRNLDRRSLYLCAIFIGQALFQHFLTQGDKLVLASVSELKELGAYAMASAYGSLAARFLLQPLEETARLYWTRNASREGEAQRQLYLSYTLLVKLVLYIGLLFGCLAVNYTWVVLNVLAGRKWGNNSQAVSVLSSYCIYTGFLALNGMTEAFVYATIHSGRSLRDLSIAHAIIGVQLAAASYFAVQRYGVNGLVVANALAMLFRSCYSLHIATDYFNHNSRRESYGGTIRSIVKDALPHPAVLVAFAGSYMSTRSSLASMMDCIEEDPTTKISASIRHIGGGVICGIGVLASAYVAEKDAFGKFSELKRLDNDNKNKND